MTVKEFMLLAFKGPNLCLVHEVEISKMQLSMNVILFKAGLALAFLYEPAEQYLCIISKQAACSVLCNSV